MQVPAEAGEFATEFQVLPVGLLERGPEGRAFVAVLPGKDLRSLLADPVPGRRLAGVEERARGLPEILELSTVSVRESYVFPGHIVVAIDVTLARG